MIIRTKFTLRSAFPVGSDSKEFACNAGDLSSIPGLGRSPWRREWLPTPVFLPGESHGQRRLVGYSPWGHRESDTTEQLHFTLRSNSVFCDGGRNAVARKEGMWGGGRPRWLDGTGWNSHTHHGTFQCQGVGQSLKRACACECVCECRGGLGKQMRSGSARTPL